MSREDGNCPGRNPISVLCSVHFKNGNATLIKVPIKQTMQENMMGFRRLGRRRRGRSERGNKMRALFLKRLQSVQPGKRKCLHTLH